MNTRREFLENAAGALAGLAFVGCDLLAAAPARAQARRREVVVSGRRVKVVDVHAHFLTGDPSWYTRTIEPSLTGASEVRRAFLPHLLG